MNMIHKVIRALQWCNDVVYGEFPETSSYAHEYMAFPGEISTEDLDFICAVCNLVLFFSESKLRVCWIAGEMRPVKEEGRLLWFDLSLLRDILLHSKLLK